MRLFTKVARYSESLTRSEGWWKGSHPGVQVHQLSPGPGAIMSDNIWKVARLERRVTVMICQMLAKLCNEDIKPAQSDDKELSNLVSFVSS